jgi:hypothetical protein
MTVSSTHVIEIKLDRLIDDMRLLRSQMIAFNRQLHVSPRANRDHGSRRLLARPGPGTDEAPGKNSKLSSPVRNTTPGPYLISRCGRMSVHSPLMTTIVRTISPLALSLIE